MSTVLTDQQVNDVLVQVAKGIFPLRNYCMVYLMLVHGLRTKEVMDLHVEDIDLINGWLHIHRSFKGMDDIHPLTITAKQLLQAWLLMRSQQYGNRKTTALFTTRYGNAWSRQGITKFFSELSGMLPFAVNSSILYQTTWESLMNLPARERDIRMYLGRVENGLAFGEKQNLQRAFAFWHGGINWVLVPPLRSQNGPKCLLVWRLLCFLQVLSVGQRFKSVSYC